MGMGDGNGVKVRWSEWSQVESKRWWAARLQGHAFYYTRLFFIVMRISDDVERERECEVHRQ